MDRRMTVSNFEHLPTTNYYQLCTDNERRLWTALEELRDAVASQIVFQRKGNGPCIPATPDDPLLAIVEKADKVLYP